MNLIPKGNEWHWVLIGVVIAELIDPKSMLRRFINRPHGAIVGGGYIPGVAAGGGGIVGYGDE